MELQKNQLLELSIRALSSDGNGVADCPGGPVVFVPGTAPGDVARVRIVKVLKSYAFGRVEELLVPGPGRMEPDCPVAAPCGGCGRAGSRWARPTPWSRYARTRRGISCPWS